MKKETQNSGGSADLECASAKISHREFYGRTQGKTAVATCSDAFVIAMEVSGAKRKPLGVKNGNLEAGEYRSHLKGKVPETRERDIRNTQKPGC